jgi:nitrogen regulatory protein P-II 1
MGRVPIVEVANMLMVVAIIRTEKLGAVKTALEGIGVHGLTAYEVSGRGEQKGLEFTHRAGKFRIDMLPKTKIEIVIKDSISDMVIDTVCKSARTGEVGDGKIFVIPVLRSVRVRTGEEDK